MFFRALKSPKELPTVAGPLVHPIYTRKPRNADFNNEQSVGGGVLRRIRALAPGPVLSNWLCMRPCWPSACLASNSDRTSHLFSIVGPAFVSFFCARNENVAIRQTYRDAEHHLLHYW